MKKEDIYFHITDLITIESVKKLIDLINNKSINNKSIKRIHLYISSKGGEVSSAMLIYYLLKSTHKEIITYGLMEIKSAAIIIFVSGNKRICLDHCIFSFHNVIGNSMVDGELNDIKLKQIQEELKISKDAMIGLISREIEDKEGACLKLINENSVITASRAIEMKITHEIKEHIDLSKIIEESYSLDAKVQ